MRPNGPIEDHSFPSELEVHVTTPGPDPRIHGYNVESDLAVYYTFAETILLSLVGKAPSREQGRAFEVALQFIAPISAPEAPAHAALLASISGARTSSITGIAAIALAERARDLVSKYVSLFNWLQKENVTGELESRFCAHNQDERESVWRLRDALGNTATMVPGLCSSDPDRWAAIFMVLSFAGLGPSQAENVLVLGSLATVFAEAVLHKPLSFRQYPMNVPQFIYGEGEDDEK